MLRRTLELPAAALPPRPLSRRVPEDVDPSEVVLNQRVIALVAEEGEGRGEVLHRFDEERELVLALDAAVARRLSWVVAGPGVFLKCIVSVGVLRKSLAR